MESKQRKTSGKDDSIAKYKWLKIVFGDIDDLKERVKTLEKEVKKLKKEKQ